MPDRTRRDLCPGLLRPWSADDGALVRLRLPGGAVPREALGKLLRLARLHGDGVVHLTRRANVQLRGLPQVDGLLEPEVERALLATGLLPATSHERVRNIMASPLTGRAGGRTDLRQFVRRLDELLCAEPRLAALAGRFLFVLDDGRGDLLARDLDLGLVALDGTYVQLRAGRDTWGPVLPLDEAAVTLVTLAKTFLKRAGSAPHSPWHVDELDGGAAALLTRPVARRPETRVAGGPPPLGRITQRDGRTALHLAVPEGRLDARLLDELCARSPRELVVTPWRTVIAPDLEKR